MSDDESERRRQVAETTARLDRVLHEARRDESRLKRILEVRRLRRRLARFEKSAGRDEHSR